MLLSRLAMYFAEIAALAPVPGADLIRGIVALWKALQAGDENRIYQLSMPISAMIAVQNSLDAFLAVEKYLLVKQGIFRNTIVRGPVGYRLDEETRREVDRLFGLVEEALAANTTWGREENRP